MTTLQDLFTAAGGGAGVFFEDLKAEDRVFRKGDFTMTPALEKVALELADTAMAKAKELNIDINKLPEVQEAKGLDKDKAHLSRQELAALIVGTYIQQDYNNDRTTIEYRGYGGLVTEINSHERPFMMEVQQLGKELSKQLFGDTHPKDSAIDTSSYESIKPITDLLKKDGNIPNRC